MFIGSNAFQSNTCSRDSIIPLETRASPAETQRCDTEKFHENKNLSSLNCIHKYNQLNIATNTCLQYHSLHMP